MAPTFIFYSNTVIFCLNAEIACGEPDIPTHGWIASTTYTYSNTVTFYCEQGYRLQGLNIIRCESNGLWSGPSPKCHSLREYC